MNIDAYQAEVRKLLANCDIPFQSAHHDEAKRLAAQIEAAGSEKEAHPLAVQLRAAVQSHLAAYNNLGNEQSVYWLRTLTPGLRFVRCFRNWTGPLPTPLSWPDCEILGFVLNKNGSISRLFYVLLNVQNDGCRGWAPDGRPSTAIDPDSIRIKHHGEPPKEFFCSPEIEQNEAYFRQPGVLHWEEFHRKEKELAEAREVKAAAEAKAKEERAAADRIATARALADARELLEFRRKSKTFAWRLLSWLGQ